MCKKPRPRSGAVAFCILMGDSGINMPALSDKAERLCAMFDSYCKTMLRNVGRNEMDPTIIRQYLLY